jgi:hypothetical protein
MKKVPKRRGCNAIFLLFNFQKEKEIKGTRTRKREKRFREKWKNRFSIL